jgi:hypothetical protein
METEYVELDTREPVQYKELKYIYSYFFTETYVEEKIIKFLIENNITTESEAESYLNHIVVLQLDDNNKILSFSYVDRDYLGPDKLYYFYKTFNVSDKNIENLLYEVTRDYLLTLNKYPHFIGDRPYSGIILSQKNDDLIKKFNFKYCETSYKEGSIWYDNFDGSDLIL